MEIPKIRNFSVKSISTIFALFFMYNEADVDFFDWKSPKYLKSVSARSIFTGIPRGIKVSYNVCNIRKCRCEFKGKGQVLLPALYDSWGNIYMLIKSYFSWPPWLMTSVGHDIVVKSTFHSLIRHGGHHDGCCMRSRKCLPLRSTWFHLWFS